MEDDKIIQMISSFGISFGALTILGIPFINNPYFIFGALGVSVAATPVVYLGVKKINEKWQEKEEKRLRCVRQTFSSLAEDRYEKDKIIGKTTTNFYSKLDDMKKEFNIFLENNDFDQINDLLYLINANYYEKIVSLMPGYCREEIIDKVVNQIGLYFVGKGQSGFHRKDLLNILNNCYFIKDEIKKEIYDEFISSEVSFGKWISHGIRNRNVDIMDEDAFYAEKKKELPSMPGFDIESTENYKKIIQGIISMDTYLGQFGDISQLEWDMESLQEFFSIMLKDHRSEIVAYNSQLSNFDIACSFIHNAMCYAVVNNKTEVGPREMLQTLKNWEKIPFQLRCDIATTVVEKMGLERNNHPFYHNPAKKKAKIISFNKLNNDESK